MALVLNGTTGVSGVAGSATTPALIGSDADSGYYINSANEPNASVNGTAVWSGVSTFGFKNRIINGAMVIDQRNAGASVTPTTNSTYTVDRWMIELSQASKLSVQQSTTAPAGFKNSLLITSLSAYSVGASDFFMLNQTIEGFNVADLAWGTASASAVTLSFWVRSSLTGTFGGGIENSATNRDYVFSYTINSANTWEYKTVVIPGDQSGTWATDNGAGLRLRLGLGVGSTYSSSAGSWGATRYFSVSGATSVVGTNGATFYITGVQLEKGSTATSFDFRSYGTELALCQRYYWQTSSSFYSIQMASNGSTRVRGIATAPVPFRAAPTVGVIGTPTFYQYTGGAITYSSIASAGGAAGESQFVLDLGITGTASGVYDFLGVANASAEL